MKYRIKEYQNDDGYTSFRPQKKILGFWWSFREDGIWIQTFSTKSAAEAFIKRIKEYNGVKYHEVD